MGDLVNGQHPLFLWTNAIDFDRLGLKGKQLWPRPVTLGVILGDPTNIWCALRWDAD